VLAGLALYERGLPQDAAHLLLSLDDEREIGATACRLQVSPCMDQIVIQPSQLAAKQL
jgi:hypothetical protein